MLTFPNCKINLGLSITRRRNDGYHDLETVFYPVTGLKDALEVVSGSGVESTLNVTGKIVSGEVADNLIWKALSLLQQRFPDVIKPVDIYLHKNIPMGAGLGGGSADGAFALRLLSDFFELNLPDPELAEMALTLGSDCPFFIYNTAQFATGRGERMSPVSIDLSAYSLQVICPGIHVSTAHAFGMIEPKPAAYDLRNLANLPLVDWRAHVVNDFEAPVFAEHPELAEIKHQLYESGAIYAAMSGSGSSLFGLFEKGKRASIAVSGDNFYLE